jgi:hypothetical protein
MRTVAVPMKKIDPVLISDDTPVDGSVISCAIAMFPILPKPPLWLGARLQE